MGHGQAEDLQTPYEGALELQEIYDSLGLYSELKPRSPGEPSGRDAWNGQVDESLLSCLSSWLNDKLRTPVKIPNTRRWRLCSSPLSELTCLHRAKTVIEMIAQPL